MTMIHPQLGKEHSRLSSWSSKAKASKSEKWFTFITKSDYTYYFLKWAFCQFYFIIIFPSGCKFPNKIIFFILIPPYILATLKSKKNGNEVSFMTHKTKYKTPSLQQYKVICMITFTLMKKNNIVTIKELLTNYL